MSAPFETEASARFPVHLASAKQMGLLVLDPHGDRLLDTAGAARVLAGAIADDQGRLAPSLALATQIRRLGVLDERPRYVRLRLDPRGIAVPTTCWLARIVRADGSPAIAVGLVDSVGTSRASAARGDAASREPASGRYDQSAPPAPPVERIVWRADATGRLTFVTGGPPNLVAALQARLWSSFPDGGVEILAALRARRTFRALPVTIRDDETGQPVDLAVSGVPLGRTDPAGGWAGFAHPLPRPVAAEASHDPEPESPEASGSDGRDGPPSVAAANGQTDTEDARTPNPSDATVDLAANGEPERDRVPDLTAPERDAFREIARALGGLLAEGDGQRSDAASADPRVWTPASRPTDETVRVVLEGLPAGVVVLREHEVLFRNRRFADLLGADTAMVGGDATLVSRLLARSCGEQLVSVAGASDPVRLLVERATIDWDGAPAILVLARAAPPVVRWIEEATAVGTLAHAGGSPAMPGRLGEGRGAIDPRGRILVVRPAPRRVGPPDRRDDEARTGDGTREPSLGGDFPRIMAGAASENRVPERGGAVVALRTRIERLLAPDEDAADASGEEDGPQAGSGRAVTEQVRASEDTARRRFAFFARVGQAVRASLGAIRDTADGLLAEPPTRGMAEPGRERIRDIRATSAEAANYLDGLLAWTWVASGRTASTDQRAALNEIVGGCIAEEQALAATARVFLRSSLAPESAALDIDAHALRRATRNAIAYAIEQSRAGGQVIVATLLAERGEAVVRVRSNGFVMGADTIARALDPFVDADADAAGQSQTEGDAGAESGTEQGRRLLGLTLARALAEVNGGRFAITSRPGEGTLVELGFPVPCAGAA